MANFWSRNKEEEMPPPVRPAAPASPTSEFPREAAFVPVAPSRMEAVTTRSSAVIGKTLTVHGHLSGREDLVVDGRVEGDIELMENRLTVGVGGHVQGGVKAREVVVFGTVNGNLEATERIEIKKNAKVLGDLRSARFVIEDEAYFKGNIDTIRSEVPKVAAAAASVAPAPKPQPAPVGAVAETVPAQPSLISGVRDSKR